MPTASFATFIHSFAKTIRLQVIATEAAGEITVNIGDQLEFIEVADAGQGCTDAKRIHVDSRGPSELTIRSAAPSPATRQLWPLSFTTF